MSTLWTPWLLSLKVALCATLIDLFVGVAIAFGLSRWRSPLRETVDALLTLPLVLPPTVLGYYLLVILGNQGWLGAYLAQWDIQLIFTWQGAVIAAAICAFPPVFKSARAAFESVHPPFEHAARCLGLSEAALFFRVTLPLAAKGILAGTLLAFARAFGEFGATLMIAGNLPGRTQTLSMAIYDAVQAGDEQAADGLVLVTSLTCIAVLLLASYLLPKRQRS